MRSIPQGSAAPAPPLAVRARADKHVLWDLTHGVFPGYEPADLYSTATAILAGDGFRVSTTTAGVANLDLTNWDVLVIANGSCWLGAYTQAEVSAIEAFVSAGGGLLVMADNTGAWPQNIAPVAQAFGTTTAVKFLFPIDLVFGMYTPHPIFQDVDRIFYRGAGELAAGSPSEAVGFTSASEPAVCVTTDSRVVVTGDVNVFDDAHIHRADNVRFLRNVFSYLGTGGPP